MNTQEARAYMANLCYGSGVYVPTGRWQHSHPCPKCGKRIRVTKAQTIGAHKKAAQADNG